MVLNELLYDPEHEPDMFEYELGCERELLESKSANTQSVFVLIIKTNNYDGDDLISSNVLVELYSNYDSAINRKNELEQIADETDTLESGTFVDIIEKKVM